MSPVIHPGSLRLAATELFNLQVHRVEPVKHTSSHRQNCSSHVLSEGLPTSLQGLNWTSQKGQSRGHTLPQDSQHPPFPYS